MSSTESVLKPNTIWSQTPVVHLETSTLRYLNTEVVQQPLNIHYVVDPLVTKAAVNLFYCYLGLNVSHGM